MSLSPQYQVLHCCTHFFRYSLLQALFVCIVSLSISDGSYLSVYFHKNDDEILLTHAIAVYCHIT